MIDPDTLTDEECLSLTGPWRVMGELGAGFVVCRSSFYGETIPDSHVFRTNGAAVKACDELNAAHVRERLRGLMGETL